MYQPLTTKKNSKKSLTDFAAKVMLLKNEAARLGLWRTMHALEPATQAVGWEIADIMTGKQTNERES